MSLVTWKKEFYAPISKVAKKDAVAHSLQKWIGLRYENLEKHSMYADKGGDIHYYHTESSFAINDTTCALCRCFNCHQCPYMLHFGKTCDDGDDSPYMVWELIQDPEPMIQALTKLKELEG